MKCKDNNLLKKVSEFKWRIESFSTVEKDSKKKPSYAEGDFFDFKIITEASGKELIDGVSLVKPCEDKTINMDFFFSIKPTWFIRDDVFYLTAFVGNDPCALHRLIMWFENISSDKPAFHFEVMPMYDDCVCDHYGSMVLYSGHGIGDGTGESR